jgi:dihydrolipoamide dehydrogenase
VILATGARAREIPAVGLAADGDRIWTYRQALTPKACPKSLLVVGSGAIGIEFASFYRALGAEVTVIEALDRILPVEDEEVSKAAQKAFEKRGLKFRVGAKVTKLGKSRSGVELTLESAGKSETLSAEAAIVAVGIDGNVENLGLEALGVKIDRGHVTADPRSATNVPGLYAIGDVAGPPWLAHKASHEGIHCVEHIAGKAGPNIPAPIPGCTYSTPQIASIGLTEAQAKAAGRKVKVGRFPFRVNGKAIASGETEGFVKTVFDDQTGALIGAHMIGGEVTEMIQGFALAMTLEATEAELFATVFPHPTMSEAMHEASLDAYGMVLHL